MDSNKQLLPEKTSDLSKVQQGWLQLANKKITTFEDLQKAELSIQGIVAGYETMDLPTIQSKMKEAKDKAAESKQQRLHFTNMLDEKLVKPAMEFEKRNDALIAKVSVKELELRQVAVKAQEAIDEKNKEIAALKTHIKNEFFRVETAYKNKLTLAIADAYSGALKAKVKPDDIAAYIEGACEMLSAIVLDKPVKFVRKLVNDDEAKAALATIQKYNSGNDLAEAIRKMKEETFAMYVEDLKNADAAIQAIEQQAEETVASNNNEMDLETATNTLIGAAEPLVMSGGPKVKKVYKLELEDTEQFAMKVLATFIKNWPEASKKLGTKSWTKLVDPFTKALEKIDTRFPDFKYTEVCK